VGKKYIDNLLSKFDNHKRFDWKANTELRIMMIAISGRRGRRRRKLKHRARQQGRLRPPNSGSGNDGRARDITRMLNQRKARMAEGSGGPGHLARRRLARIAHDPQHVCNRQLPGCGCFLPTCSFARLAAPVGRPAPRRFPPRPFILRPRALRFGLRFTCTTIRYSTDVQCGAAPISLVRRNDVLVEHWAKIERTA
jgi:hypothetical protein